MVNSETRLKELCLGGEGRSYCPAGSHNTLTARLTKARHQQSSDSSITWADKHWKLLDIQQLMTDKRHQTYPVTT